MASEYSGNIGKYTKAILYLHTNLVASEGRARVKNRQVSVDGLTGCVSAECAVVGSSDEVRKNSGRGGSTTCTLTVEHQTACCFTFDEDGVERSIDTGQRRIERDERGVNAHGNAVFTVFSNTTLSDGKKLDRTTEEGSFFHIFCRDLGDALNGNVIDSDARMESQRGQN